MRKYFHGALCSPEDKRDYQFKDLIAGATLKELPDEYVNPLAEYVEVVDQGETETCVACSLSYLRWLTEKIQSNNEKVFSPTYIYGNREECTYTGEGMIVREALQTLRKQGVCYYEDLPGFYDVQTAIAQYEANKEILDPKAKPFRISSFYAIDINDNEAIKSAIYNLGGIIVSYPIYKCLYSPNSKGEIEYKKSNTTYGYHAMTIVGWTTTHWIVLNSWGEEYGDGGFCYIPFDYPLQEAWGIVDEITEVMFKMAKFSDIEGHWAEEYIDKAVEDGIVNGFEDGTFKPDDAVTRAQLCTILDRLNLL